MRLGVFGGTFDPVHNAHLFRRRVGAVARGPRSRAFRSYAETTTIAASRRRSGRSLRDDPRRDRENPAFALDETDLREDASRLHRRSPSASAGASIPARALRSSSAPIRWPSATGYVSTKCSRRSSDSRSRRAPAFTATRWRALSRRCRRRCESASRPSICPKSRRPRVWCAISLAQGAQRALSRARAGLEVHYRARTLRLSRAERQHSMRNALAVALVALLAACAAIASARRRAPSARAYTAGRSHVEVVADGTVTRVLGGRAGAHESARRVSLTAWFGLQRHRARRGQYRFHRARFR